MECSTLARCKSPQSMIDPSGVETRFLLVSWHLPFTCWHLAAPVQPLSSRCTASHCSVIWTVLHCSRRLSVLVHHHYRCCVQTTASQPATTRALVQQERCSSQSNCLDRNHISFCIQRPHPIQQQHHPEEQQLRKGSFDSCVDSWWCVLCRFVLWLLLCACGVQNKATSTNVNWTL